MSPIVKPHKRKSVISVAFIIHVSLFFLPVMGAGSLITWNRILIELETARLPFMSYLDWERREREKGERSGVACRRM